MCKGKTAFVDSKAVKVFQEIIFQQLFALGSIPVIVHVQPASFYIY